MVEKSNKTDRFYAEQALARVCRDHQDTMPAHDRFLRLPEVRNRVPYGRASIYRLIAAGDFPKPYLLGARAVAWLESEIEEWIARRVAAAK